MPQSEEVEYRPVPGYPHYFACSDGFIRREACVINGKKYPAYTFGQDSIRNGYLTATLLNHEGPRTFIIHKLIDSVWYDNPLDLPVVNHINFNKQDNRPCNLEFATQGYNVKWSRCFIKMLHDEIPIGATVLVQMTNTVTQVMYVNGHYITCTDGNDWIFEHLKFLS